MITKVTILPGVFGWCRSDYYFLIKDMTFYVDNERSRSFIDLSS
jgi:hypothetical protein